jgi:hypothetical protein
MSCASHPTEGFRATALAAAVEQMIVSRKTPSEAYIYF